MGIHNFWGINVAQDEIVVDLENMKTKRLSGPGAISVCVHVLKALRV